MFIFPLLMPVFGLSAAEYGLWAGTAIHEVAQVIGAGFQNGMEQHIRPRLGPLKGDVLGLVVRKAIDAGAHHHDRGRHPECELR